MLQPTLFVRSCTFVWPHHSCGTAHWLLRRRAGMLRCSTIGSAICAAPHACMHAAQPVAQAAPGTHLEHHHSRSIRGTVLVPCKRNKISRVAYDAATGSCNKLLARSNRSIQLHSVIRQTAADSMLSASGAWHRNEERCGACLGCCCRT